MAKKSDPAQTILFVVAVIVGSVFILGGSNGDGVNKAVTSLFDSINKVFNVDIFCTTGSTK